MKFATFHRDNEVDFETLHHALHTDNVEFSFYEFPQGGRIYRITDETAAQFKRQTDGAFVWTSDTKPGVTMSFHSYDQFSLKAFAGGINFHNWVWQSA